MDCRQMIHILVNHIKDAEILTNQAFARGTVCFEETIPPAQPMKADVIIAEKIHNALEDICEPSENNGWAWVVNCFVFRFSRRSALHQHGYG